MGKPFLVFGLAGLLLIQFLASCARSKKDPDSFVSDPLEVLTLFSEAVSQKNWEKAAAYINPEERRKIQDGEGKVTREHQRALSALRFSTLAKSSGVRVERGYIYGIYDALPVLSSTEDLASSAEASSNTLPLFPEPDAELAFQIPGNMHQVDVELSKMRKKFNDNLARKNWKELVQLIAEDEKSILVDEKGNLKRDYQTRLAKLKPSDLESLTLRDGRLANVLISLPP